MKRFVQGDNRTQSFLLPDALDDYVTDTNPVRVVDVFVDELDLQKLGFEGVEPALTGRPSYHPEVMLKIYIYGYLNRIQSSRRLEREAQRNIELMWLTGRLAPDFKTIARFAKTTVKRSATSVVSSSCYANAWTFLPKRLWLSTAVSLRR
jgi:transposase